MLAVCAAAAQGPGGPGASMPPPEVTVVLVETKSMPMAYEYLGVAEPSKTIDIRARVQGFVETRDFEEGSLIEQGAQLYAIDAAPFRADRDIARARVHEAESRRRLAEQELQRVKSVCEPGAVAAGDIDKKEAERASAAAALELAQAQLAKAELELGYTIVKAPLSGVVGKSLKEVGSLVDGNQNSLLTTLKQVDPLYVTFHMQESDYLLWRNSVDSHEIVLEEGLQEPYLELVLVDGSIYDQKGRIDFEDSSVDRRKGSVEMRGVFENPGHTLKPGQFLKVRVKGWRRPNVPVIPQRAVGQAGDGSYVYVVGPEDKVEQRTITIGPWSDSECGVVEGLQSGERVVVEGLTKLRPGIRVVPKEPSAPPAATAMPDAPPAQTAR